MTKTRHYKRRMYRRKSYKSKKGGSYYAYNTNPLRFTSSSSKMGGGFTMDTRETLFPQAIVNLGRSFMDNINSTNSTYYGRTTIIPSDPTSQPIGTMKSLKF